MFSDNAQSLPQFSEKLNPLIVANQFPLTVVAVSAFKQLREGLASATLEVIDEKLPFVSETDASDNAISATLNQQNRSEAFFQECLSSCCFCCELNPRFYWPPTAHVVKATQFQERIILNLRASCPRQLKIVSCSR